MECSTAAFSKFLAELSKFAFWVADWLLTIDSTHFKDFVEISQFTKIQSLKSFVTHDATCTFAFWK